MKVLGVLPGGELFHLWKEMFYRAKINELYENNQFLTKRVAELERAK